METWLTYAPRDFLLFSQETYWRLFQLANAAVWPAQIALTAVLPALALAALTGWRRTALLAGLLLAAAWGFVAEAFLAARYEPINWAIAYVQPVFLVEAALLVSVGLPLAFPATGLRRAAGLLLVVLAAGYPLVGVAAGRPLAQAEVFAIAPDPTAIGTLGILLLARGGWRPALLAVIPIAWLLLSALTLLTMDAATGFVPLGAALAATLVMILGAFRSPARPALRER